MIRLPGPSGGAALSLVLMADRDPDALLWTWLGFIDANALSDDEGKAVARFDIEDDAQLAELVENWIRPKFLELNEISQTNFRAILDSADSWRDDQLKVVFNYFRMPSGQRIRDVPRFIRALKGAART